MSPGVVMPALSGRVFCMFRNDGESALSIRTKVCPPKYIWVPWGDGQRSCHASLAGDENSHRRRTIERH